MSSNVINAVKNFKRKENCIDHIDKAIKIMSGIVSREMIN